MDSLKRKGRILLGVSFCLFILLQQIAVRYRWTRTSTVEMADTDGNDTLASYEINQLEKLWRKAAVEDLVTLEKMANPQQLEQARLRLKQAEIGIRESEMRVRGMSGKKHEFFQKAHAYYRHSASALINIVDFLLAKQGKYSVKKGEISFESDTDAVKFRGLIEQLSDLHREKKNLDAFILNHNREVSEK